MPREQIVIPSRQLSYTGVFSINEVQEIMRQYLIERDYNRIEKSHEHKQYGDGTVIESRGFHEKKITDQDQFEFDIFMTCSGLKDIEISINHEKKKMNSGTISLGFKGILFTDRYNEMWGGGKGWNFKFGPVVRWVAETFVFKEQDLELKAAVKKDVDDLYDKLTEYFNMNSYQRMS